MALKLSSNIDMDKVVKSLGQKYKLAPHIDMFIAKGEMEWEFLYKPKKVDDAWHPSGDCTPSLRELYLKAKGQLDDRHIAPSLRKTWMVGHFWHQWLQEIVLNLGFATTEAIERKGRRVWGTKPYTPVDVLAEGGYQKPDVPLPYHWATGSGDIAPCSIPGDGDYAVDFKTMNARSFSQSAIPAFYADKWECQGNVYMDFFGMEKIIFVGICKDSPHDMKEWVFERNQPLIDAIYQKWQLVSACLDEDIEPPEGEEVHLPLKGPIAS